MNRLEPLEYGFKKIISDILVLFEKNSCQVNSSLDVALVSKCCGAGGGMSMYNKEYVRKRMGILLENEFVALASNIMTACPFCYLNFEKNSSKKISFITENLEVVAYP